MALSLGLFIAAIPAYYTQTRSLAASALPNGWTQAALRDALAQLGISVDFYTIYQLAIEGVFTLVYTAIALLIVRYRSDEWVALLVSLWLITFATNAQLMPSLVERQPEL
ncbi:MAG TPA: hypothetical protein VFX76_08885, partial [Roseiflexaceae bacterium]|nr:hypothetical protein [Roseiflexaceae bacterium]